ncbi:hemK methyltransferase family member 2 [Panicum miliaceum]|uniref:HemK methyltransferase family member 2 n=1 Tax=Panicum miliaceum TaxID=4540 RepID=A0A3L6TPV6_PANMI|nr:hemK methyltransferase family member 2 [Panicum miliaceum]
MADGDGAAASRNITEHSASGGEKGLPRRGKSSSGRTLNTAQIPLVASHPEVYEPCDDSFALVDALLSDKAQLLALQPRLCMEVGCGSGYVITSLAIMLRQLASGTQYLATDINKHAAETTQATLEAHGVHADVMVTDIVSGLEKRLAGMVDVVVINPPYVPTPEEEIGCKGIASSWAGGLYGRQVINRILPAVREILSERGWLYMVTLEDNDPLDICHLMSEMGYASRVVLKRCTEEESLFVLKFWRDPHTATNVSPKSPKSESWLSHLPFKSLWHKGS